ncbi:hypothetical protein [Paenibacillus radicis (ex Gao et al. 2016)]|nr:hypothetical protein [Paenibacillus radicis (ex Gao et al. 2016)]
MMKWLRRGVLLMAMLLGVSSIPAIGFALPGEISYYSGSTLFTRYTGSETFNGSAYTPHSPNRYNSYEKRFKLHFDKYRYKFRSSGSTTFYFAIAKITPEFPDGQSMYEQQLSSFSSYSNYLDGDYYIYMYDFSGNTSNLNLSQLEVSAVTPGEVRLYSPGSFSYTSGYFAGSGSSYLLRGSTHTIDAYVEGVPTSVVASVTTSTGTTVLGNLSYVPGTIGRYKLDYTFNEHYDTRNAQKPTLKITATYPNDIRGASVVVASQPIYVTEMDYNYYQRNDSTWYYNSPTDNSFAGPATSAFTCYHFVADISDTSYTGSPQQGNDADIINFMKKQGAHASRPGISYSTASMTPIAFPDAIYYTNYHFAKVTNWDASGNPTEIVSKWGGLELIKSTSAAPFSNSIATYGAPRIYFKR